MPLSTVDHAALTVVQHAEAAPATESAELVRPRVLELLAGRWSVPVTAVVAGPGFGKTVALAQAVRANQARPRGVDVRVQCGPGDGDAGRFAEGIVRAMGTPVSGRADGTAAAVVRSLRETYPNPVCLVIDDLHELASESPAVALLAEVLASLPAHAHLVVASRRPLPLPLARLRAAGAVLDVDQDTLRYTPAELEVLALRAGRDPAAVTGLAGWPALVRLGLLGMADEVGAYLWDEVVARLPVPQRRALLALATLGTADSASLTELCGEPVNGQQLARRVPLIVDAGHGQVRAHDLWNVALRTALPAEEVRAMGHAAARHLLARGHHVRAGSLAARTGDTDALCEAALRLVRDTMSLLPVDTADSWLAAPAPRQRGRPELVLLDAARRHAACHRDRTVPALLDRALAGFRECGNPAGEHAVLAFRLVMAHVNGDHAGAAEVLREVGRLPGASQDAMLVVLAAVAAATKHHLGGEVDAALSVLDTVSLAGVGPVIAETLTRLRWHLLMLAGRAEEAAQLGRRALATASTPNAPLFDAVGRWLAGDPTGFDDVDRVRLVHYDRRAETATQAHVRDWFNHGVFTAMVWASAGARTAVARALLLLTSLDIDTTSSRNAAPLAVARAANAIVNHDDRTAERVIASFVAEHPLSDRCASVWLRRFLAIPYVCSEEARTRWDAEALGPSHRLQRDVAVALLAARDGTLTASTALPEPEAVYTALPLPWSLELAARAHATGNPGGGRLARWLVDRLGGAARAELRLLTSAPEATLAQAAERLFDSIPVPPDHITRIEVLGPLQLLVGGSPVDRTEQRRTRVRELLALLVVRTKVDRDRAMDLLWPDLTPADAARNLRVTLTHLRRMLEPDRGRGEDTFHVRVDATHIRLVASSQLAVDLWELREHLNAAAAARAAGDVAAEARHLREAVGLWRADPLCDLDRVPDLAIEVDHLRMQLVDAALTLGELSLAHGDPAAALNCADRALATDPYEERALRLLIAAHLQRGDRAKVRLAVQRTLGALCQLGAQPHRQTAILLGQARLLTGRERSAVPSALPSAVASVARHGTTRSATT